jgi:hypothetical protein
MSFFLHPALAWAGLFLVAIPVIIHLINRRRLRRLEWAAMEFLLDALKKNRRRIRLEHLLLLLCRMALMALIALFLARPLLSDRGFGWLASAFQSEDKIFVIDDSLSMAQRLADRTVFERGNEALVSAIRRLAEQGSRDRVTVLRASRPQAVIGGTFIDRERAASLEQAIRAMAPASTRLHLARLLEHISEQAARGAAGGAGRPRAVSIVTDLRAADWTDSGGGPSAALAKALERLTADPENPARLIILDAGAEETANVAVTGVAIDGGRPTVDLPAPIQAEVRNLGNQPVRDLRLRLSFARVGEEMAAPNSALAPPIAEIGPRQSAIASIPCTFRSPGQYWGTIEVTGSNDSLAADNSYSFVLEVARATEVLIVDGEPSAEPFEGESDFLAIALNPGGEVSSGIEPLVAVEESLPRDDISRFGAVFLANVYSLPEEFRGRLGRYVRAGGSLVIFLGDQVDPLVYGRELGASAPAGSGEDPARGLLPARIGELRSSDDSPVTLAPAYDHPLFRFLRGGGERYIEEAAFRRYFVLEPLPTAQVVARFAGADDTPAIVQGPAGAGSVVLIASSADAEWNDWPRNLTYLMTLQEMVAAFGRSSGREPSHAAGSRIEVPLDITTHSREARYRAPGYPRSPERSLIASTPPAGAPDDRLRFVIEETSQAGLAFLGLKSRAGEEEWRALSIHSEPEESDLRRITPERLKELYPDIPLAVVRDPARFSESGRGRFEISDLLLWVFVLFLFLEAVLAWRFGHHRSGSAAPLKLGGARGAR